IGRYCHLVRMRMKTRSLLRDASLCCALFVIAVVSYESLFLRVPVLTETRDFIFNAGWGATAWAIVVPTGTDVRPFSWAFFGWQRRMFGLDAETLNLVQFSLLGFCASAAYVHLRQLALKRPVAFGASALWLLSFPALHAAFWQATQHDKLG